MERAADRLHPMLARERARHLDRFEALVRHVKSLGVEVEPHFLEGPPAPLLVASVSRLNIDLLVMGTIGRTGIAGFWIGNTAEQVLERVHCPLLAIKPDGFRSPIPLGA